MRPFILLVLLCTVLTHCKTTNSPTTPNQVSGLPGITFPLDQPLVSGHRGSIGAPGWPENCLETYAYLRKSVPGIMECDVARTKDGTLILMHDNSIDRTTNGTGKVVNQTWDELKALQLKDDQGNLTEYTIPSFKSILKWAKESKTILSVDIKRSVDHKEVIDFIRANEAVPYCMIITYSLDQAIENYTYAPEFYQSVSIRGQKEFDRWATQKLPPANRVIAFTGTRNSPKELYDQLHAEGIPTIFGTFGNIDRQASSKGSKVYHELLQKGVDIIATNTPEQAQKAIEAFQK